MYASFHKRRVRVLESYIHYVDTRTGEDTIIFLHGNMTSSFLWRDVIPHVQGYARCIAPDLLGMGNSGINPQNEYGFETQYKYLCEWIKLLDLRRDKIVFVGYEWGVALASRWTHMYPHKVKAFVHMEGINTPIRQIEDLNCKLMQNIYNIVQDRLQTDTFKSLRISKSVRSTLGHGLAVLDTENGHGSLLTCGNHAVICLIRDLPIRGIASDEIIQILHRTSTWLAGSSLPKLLIEAEPGIHSAYVSECTRGWKNQKTVIMKCKAPPPESCPRELGDALVHFIKTLQLLTN